MLLNNFRKLITFGYYGAFTNVLGSSVNKINFLNRGTESSCVNSYIPCVIYNFNYNATTASNNYTQELTTYSWKDVLSTSTSSTTSSTSSSRYNGFTIFVGTGETTPTAEDYKLDTPVELDVLDASCYHFENGMTVVSRTFQNNTESDVTIKEIGVYIFAHGGNTASHPCVMIARTVLDTPITIPVGDVHTFSYKIDFSQIQFAEADEVE